MDYGDVLLIERSFERMIISCSGLLSIYFGFRLFRVTSTSTSSGDFAGKGFSIKLKQVGPGVFFCAFGAAILALLVRQTVTSKEFDASTGVTHVTSSAVGAPSAFVLDDVEALDRLIDLATATKDSEKNLALTIILAQAEGTKRKLVSAIYGASFMEWYFRATAAKDHDSALFIHIRESASSDWNKKYERLQKREQNTIKN